MRLLAVEYSNLTDTGQIAGLREALTARGHSISNFIVSGEVDRSELLEQVLGSQCDVVLVRAGGDDSRVSAIADVVWKFDSDTCVVSLAEQTGLQGVTASCGDVETVVLAVERLRGGNGGSVPIPAASRALLVSRGWVAIEAPVIPASTVATVVALRQSGGLEHFTDHDGWVHYVGDALLAALLPAIDDPNLGAVIGAAIGEDVWLGTIEVLSEAPPWRWRREFEHVRKDAASAAFRPGLSLLISLADETIVEAAVGSHRAPGTQEPLADASSPVLTPSGHAVLIEGACRFRSRAPVLHLRFVRPWMKPDVLLGPIVRRMGTELGEQARRWCGVDASLATSVDEFLAAEELAIRHGAGRGKGSGI